MSMNYISGFKKNYHNCFSSNERKKESVDVGVLPSLRLNFTAFSSVADMAETSAPMQVFVT